MVEGAYVHRDLGCHFRRHRGDLRHVRGCHLLAGAGDPPYRWTLGRAFRHLADRSWAGPEGSCGRSRVRPRSAARSPRRAAERGGASSPRLAGEAEFGRPGSTSPISGSAAFGSLLSSSARLAPSSAGLSAAAVPFALGRLSSSGGLVPPCGGRPPAFAEPRPSS